jgi:hypothetical protein
MSYQRYWDENTFAIADRVAQVRSLLTLKAAPTTIFKRVGSQGDGGYILAEDDKHFDVVSYGVDKNIDFEAALADGLRHIDLYDHSVNQLPYDIKNGTFYKKQIGTDVSIDDTWYLIELY